MLFRSEAEARKAQVAAEAAFGGAGNLEAMPTTEIPTAEAVAGVPVLDLLVRTGLAGSKGEARRLIDQGGLTIDDVKVTQATKILTSEELSGNGVMMRKGKKGVHRVVVK